MTGGKERLDSWKEIAAYLGRSVRTVQRWERESGLPVRRVKSAKESGSVYAFRSELDAWLERGKPEEKELSPQASASQRSNRRWVLAGAFGLAVLAALTAGLRFDSDEPSSGPTPIALTRDGGVTADPAVSADGKWLAYTSDRDGGDDLDIWIQPLPLGSASPTQITNRPGNEIRPDFSPDGNEILWEAFGTRRDGIYLTSLEDSKTRYVVGGARAKHSPDGRWIAARGGGRGLVVVEREGGRTSGAQCQPCGRQRRRVAAGQPSRFRRAEA